MFVNLIKKILGISNKSTSNPKTWREAFATQSNNKKFSKNFDVEKRKIMCGKAYEYIKNRFQELNVHTYAVSDDLLTKLSHCALSGNRASSLVDSVKEENPDIKKKECEAIIRTIFSIASSYFDLDRSKNEGCNWYVWQTSQDSRVRQSHKMMQGVLVNYGCPPILQIDEGIKKVAKSHAGESWDCRCYSEPILNLKDIKSPLKVYFNGQIVKMTKAEFRQRFGDIK